jgi:hypothetical protein
MESSFDLCCEAEEGDKLCSLAVAQIEERPLIRAPLLHAGDVFRKGDLAIHSTGIVKEGVDKRFTVCTRQPLLTLPLGHPADGGWPLP